jgi:hypothetical protein
MTPKELEGIAERWKPGTLLPETSVYDYLGHCASDVNTLLAHIREQEVYVMAGKLYEKFPSFNITPILVFQSAFLKHFHDGKYWWMVDGHEDSDQEFDSWESAVRDAYKTLV